MPEPRGGLTVDPCDDTSEVSELFVTRTKIMQGRATTLDLQSARPRRVNSESMTFSSITIFKLISVPILLQRIRSDDASFIYLPYIVFLL